MGSNTAWHAISMKKKVFFDSGKIYEVEVPGLERTDGLIVIRDRATRNKLSETFLFKGNFGVFKIEASRVGALKPDRPSEIYKVWPNSFHRYWRESDFLISAEENKALCWAHLQDIESALLNFPLASDFKNIPVKKVVFNKNTVAHPQFVEIKELTHV